MQNDSGLQPVDDKVLVLPDTVDEWVGKDKLLVMAQTTLEREQMAQVKATLVAVGGLAFHDWKPPIPQIGDRVLVGKYAGVAKLGKEARFQMINDRDICAIITEEF